MACVTFQENEPVDSGGRTLLLPVLISSSARFHVERQRVAGMDDSHQPRSATRDLSMKTRAA